MRKTCGRPQGGCRSNSPVCSRRLLKEYSGSRDPRLSGVCAPRLCAFRQRRDLDVRRFTVVSAAPEPKAKNERRRGVAERAPRLKAVVARRRDAGSTAQPPCAQHYLGHDLTRLKGCGGTAPTTLRAVPPLLELLAVANAMASSLRPTLSRGYPGAGTVASRVPVRQHGWRPTVLLQQPSHTLAHLDGSWS